MSDGVLYGIGNWYTYNDQLKKGLSVFEELLKHPSWASFGYIAAEADYKKLQTD